MSVQRGAKSDQTTHLRLLIVFDALLREGSVVRAAAALGLTRPTVSLMLAKLRKIHNDPLFKRTSNGLVPTPFSERLRPRLRRLAFESEQLILAPSETEPAAPGPGVVNRAIEALPLAARPQILLQDEPRPIDVARQIALIDQDSQAWVRLAKYISVSASGIGRSRPLSRDEAMDAMSIILRGEGDPVQIGALLATMQYRGLSAPELAGLVEAMRQHVHKEGADRFADLDWPAYVSPQVQRPPWFIHSARLVAQAGYRVLLHGFYRQGTAGDKMEQAVRTAGIRVCDSPDEAKEALASSSIAYLPIGSISAPIQRLLHLYSLVRMAHPVHVCVHLLNPLRAKAILLGVSIPSRPTLLRDAASSLADDDLTILGSIRHFAEFTPFRPTTLYRLVDGQPCDMTIPKREAVPAEPPPAAYTNHEYWSAVWTGAARDNIATAIIIDTAAAALCTISGGASGNFEVARERATALWHRRLTR